MFKTFFTFFGVRGSYPVADESVKKYGGNTKMRIGYCPNCKLNVQLTRKEFNWVLAIILGVFTGGILLLIYLAIYFSKPEDRCPICGTVGQPQIVHAQVSSAPQQVQASPQVEIIEKEPTKAKGAFCTNCGEILSDNPDMKFCTLCGKSVA